MMHQFVDLQQPFTWICTSEYSLGTYNKAWANQAQPPPYFKPDQSRRAKIVLASERG